MPKILLRRLRDGDGLIPARTLLQIEGQRRYRQRNGIGRS